MQTVSCLSVLLVHAEWLGFLTVFYPLLPQLMEQPGAPVSYEGSTFISKLEELSLSGLPLELAVVVLLVGGGCTVVAAALTGIASSLHSSRRQWREWKETAGNCGRQKGVVAGVASWVVFVIPEEGVLWTGVNFANRGSYGRRRVMLRDRSTAQGVE